LENSTDLIQQLRRQEEALRESEERFRSVLETSMDCIYRLNLQTKRYEYVSPSTQDVVGYSADEMASLDAEAAQVLIHPDDLPAVRAALARLETSGEETSDYRLRAKDGKYRWLSNHMALTRDSAGRPLYRNGNIRDITERKRAEESLRLAVSELKQSNESLEQFAYVASHDLQEPLRMVTSFMGLLQDKYQGKLDDKAQKYIGFACEGATRMSELIKDLLEFARVGTGGHQPVPVDLSAVADQVRQNLQAAIEESNAAITADPLPTVTAVPAQMSQLLQNLLSNAIKFRTKGRRPEIHIGAQKVSGIGSEASGTADQGADAPTRNTKPPFWRISVRDNGIGIAPGHRELVFQVFQRLHTREEYPGSGLGLAICKRIVERHGGRIWVESAPGEGATFFFSLPADDAGASIPSTRSRA
jgi:PAS domain S-box-containing protein